MKIRVKILLSLLVYDVNEFQLKCYLFLLSKKVEGEVVGSRLFAYKKKYIGVWLYEIACHYV